MKKNGSKGGRRRSVTGAAEVIRRAAGAREPADAVLRRWLRAHKDADSGSVSRLVFQYYRWYGWVRDERNLERAVVVADATAGRYRRQPETFADAELKARALPAWAAAAVDISPDGLRQLQDPPRLWLRSRPGGRSKLLRSLGDCRPGPDPLPESLEYRGQQDLFKTALFRSGAFEIQDVASQAVGRLCSPRPGESWWDVCAGEGGKTLHLADLMENRGLIWATDRAHWRLDRLKRRAARAQVFNYRTALWDGMAKPPFRTRFDGILVDAPCSGIGTWQRNPHARWTTDEKTVQELAEIQFRLLERVSASLKPGGRLVYSVCTLTHAESSGVCDRLEEAIPSLKREPLTNPFNGDVADTGRLWLWPEVTGGTGMFVAVWRKP